LGKLLNDWNKELGMGYTKVKETYFPNVLTKIVRMQLTCEEWMERFKVLYAEMGMPSACEFTRKRPAGETTANTWVKRTGCDIIVSWNFKHIVNVKTMRGIKVVTTMEGYKDLLIYPPSALLEEDYDDE